MPTSRRRPGRRCIRRWPRYAACNASVHPIGVGQPPFLRRARIMLRRKVSNLTSRLWRPEWVCPRCGRPFANANQSHSCEHHTVRAFLERRTPQAIALYRRFASLVRWCGPVAIVPTQTRIGFQVRGIFASINKLDDSHLDANVVLGHKLERAPNTRAAKMGISMAEGVESAASGIHRHPQASLPVQSLTLGRVRSAPPAHRTRLVPVAPCSRCCLPR